VNTHTRIYAAEQAISTGRLGAGWGEDGDHKAAVELESRGLLTGVPSAVWAVLAHDPLSGQTVVLDGSVRLSESEAQETADVCRELHPDVRVVRLEVKASEPTAEPKNPERIDGDGLWIRGIGWRRIVSGWGSAVGWSVKYRTPEVRAEGWYVVHPTRHRFGTLLEQAESERDALFAATAFVLAAAAADIDGSPGDLYDPTDAESAGGGLS
jgi:hypothetical protein